MAEGIQAQFLCLRQQGQAECYQEGHRLADAQSDMHNYLISQCE